MIAALVLLGLTVAGVGAGAGAEGLERAGFRLREVHERVQRYRGPAGSDALLCDGRLLSVSGLVMERDGRLLLHQGNTRAQVVAALGAPEEVDCGHGLVWVRGGPAPQAETLVFAEHGLHVYLLDGRVLLFSLGL